MTNRNCERCGQELNIYNCSVYKYKDKQYFNKNCKVCRNLYSREKYISNNDYRIRALNNAKKYGKENSEKISQYQKQYYLDNTDYIKERIKKWGLNNYEKLCKTKHNYYENNKNILREKKRKYRQTSKGKLCKRITEHKRRAELKSHEDGTVTGKAIIELLEKQNYLCNITSESLYRNGILYYHIDHIIPISKGGAHSIKNIQLVIPEYNMLKNNNINYSVEEFRRDLQNSAFTKSNEIE